LEDYVINDVPLEDVGRSKRIILPQLNAEEKEILDPMVAPTSGLRIKIFDDLNENGKIVHVLTNKNLFLFLRLFKAISDEYRSIKFGKELRVLIVTDDRPSNDILLRYSSQIFAHEGYEIFYQQDEPGKSRISSPYAAASVELLENINLIIMLTASHNDLSWNGVKFYIDYPIPMSGKSFKEISKRALELKEIYLNPDYKINWIDAEKINNDYVKRLVSRVIDIKSLKNKSIVIWPYLGKARGIINLFKDLGAKITMIEKTVNPPNPIKILDEKVLQSVMEDVNSDLAILLDADRDRIALYVKQDGEYFFYIPNEIYSAMHKILADKYKKKVVNVRTIPSDPRGDEASFLNIFTGVGYKHLGVILYFLFGIEVEKSKIDSAILYFENAQKEWIKIDNPQPLREYLSKLIKNDGEGPYLVVMWEESGGHTLNILSIDKDAKTGEYKFYSELPLIADKYPVPALVIISELIARGYLISKTIDWSIKGINQTISAVDQEKVKIMNNFQQNDGKKLTINHKEYKIQALSDNDNIIDIFRLKSLDSTLYFRPSGTGPEVRFYIFADKNTYMNEIKTVQEFVKKNYS
jgi:phosphomannomutase